MTQQYDEPALQKAVAVNPMRRVITAVCVCGHQWKAPTIGACPKCHGTGPHRVVDDHVNMLERL